jgi:hypothetical protein
VGRSKQVSIVGVDSMGWATAASVATDDRVAGPPTERSLDEDEHLLVVTHGFWRRWMWLTWLIVPAVIVRSQRRRSTLVVTERRVLHQHGLLRRRRMVIQRAAIEDVYVRQGRFAHRQDRGELVIVVGGMPDPVRIGHVDGARPVRNILLSPLTTFSGQRQRLYR